MIHFQCPTCGAAFDVAANLAGRTARCKKCGGRMEIPFTGAAVAEPAGAPRPRGVGAAVPNTLPGPRLTPIDIVAVARPQPSIAVGRPTNWLDAVTSQVALAPISADGLRGVSARPSPLDEPSIPGPYKLATAPSLPALEAAHGRPAGAVTIGYRGAMGRIQKLFRWLNESAYLVSVPFLMCLLIGLTVGNYPLMVLGATVAVLLNIERIVTGVANLVVIPFRESPIQGILFLIPPFTFFYLYQHWHKVHRPVKRIIGPIVTISLVVAAFVIEPWLRNEVKPKGSPREQVKSSVGTLKKEMKGQLGRVPNLDLKARTGASSTTPR
jgi:predicted Zn finger-like uncharacterized protein